MTTLKCIGRYRNDRLGVAYVAGEIFDVDESRATYLLADAPGCFEVVPEVLTEKAIEKPAKNKMVTSAAETK